MLKISSIDEKRLGQENMNGFDIAAYSRKLFGMLGGESKHVTLECHNHLAGVIIDRFGKDTVMVRSDADHFLAHIDVIPSDQFLGWIIGLGADIKIISPSTIIDRIKAIIKQQAELYI